MLKRLVCGLVWFSLLLPSLASALGLGSIEVRSALNEPLDARIPLDASTEEMESLRVQLASQDAFRQAGLERPFFLSGLQFEPIVEGAGAPYVRVTTEEPVREPFLAFLTEVRWAGGRLQREYTVFLDPPTYSDRVAVPPATGAGQTDWPERRATVADESPAAGEPLSPAPRSASGVRDYGPVRENQTGWQVASELRRGDVSVQQVLMALVRENPQAFAGGNANNLLAGAILRMPSREQILALSEAEARRELARHTSEWQASRVAAAPDPASEPVADAAEQVPEDEPPAEGVAAEADEAVEPDDSEFADEAVDDAAEAGVAEAGEDAPGRLQVLGAEGLAGEDMTEAAEDEALEPTSENIRRLQNELVAMRESEAALRSENEELRQMTREMRERLEALERVVNLQAEPPVPVPYPVPALEDAVAATDGASAHEDAAAEELPEEVPVAAETDDHASSADEEDALAAAAGDSPDAGVEADGPVQPETAGTALDETAGMDAAALSFMLQDQRLQWMGAGAALLLLLLLLLVVRRRREEAEAEEMYDDDDTPVTVSSSTATAAAAAGGAATTAVTAAAPDAARDLLGEVELEMTYGRYENARRLVDQGLEARPNDQELRFKLLELHALNEDRNAFEAEAEMLRGQVENEQDSVWQRTAELGRGIAPDNPLFQDGDQEDSAAPPDELPELAVDAGEEAELRGVPADESNADGLADLDFDLDEALGELDGEAVAPLVDAGDEAVAATEDDADAGEPDSASVTDDRAAGDDDLSLDFELDDFAAATAAEETPPSAEDDELSLDFDLPDADTAEDEATMDWPAGETATDAGDVAPAPREESGDEPGAPAASIADTASVDEDDDEPIDVVDENNTKLDLARAYLDMGDAEGARGLLEEVMEEGSEEQQREARTLSERAGA